MTIIDSITCSKFFAAYEFINDAIFKLLATFANTHTFISLNLHCYYLIVQAHGAPETRADTASLLYYYMYKIGASMRGLGRLAVLVSALLAYPQIVSRLYSRLNRAPIRRALTGGFVLFAINLTEYRARMSARIDRLISDLIVSNLNHSGYDRKRPTETWNSTFATRSLGNTYVERHMNRRGSPDISAHVSLDDKLSVECLDSIGSNLSSEYSKQLRHLLYLKKHKHKVWPEHRSTSWHERMTNEIVWLMIIIVFLSTFEALIANIFLEIVARRTNAISDKMYHALDGETQIISDRLTHAVRAILFYYVCSLNYKPLAIISMSLIDIAKATADLFAKVNLVNKHLQDSIANGNTEEVCRRRRKSVDSPSNMRADRVHLCNCDKFATETYIAYRLWLHELEYARDTARIFLEIPCYTAILMVAATCSCPSTLDADHRSLFNAFVIGSYIVANIVHIILSSTATNCKKLMKPLWSMLAYNTELNQRSIMPYSEAPFLEASRADSIATQSHLSAHTMMLWRAIVQDFDKIIDTFTFAALGLKMSYSTMLRINFWFFSLVALYSNGR